MNDTSNDLYHCFEKCFNVLEVDCDNFSSITTDGTPAMIDIKVGLVFQSKSKAMTYGVDLKSVHFIIHQESSCSKKI